MRARPGGRGPGRLLEWLAPEETCRAEALPLTLLLRPGPLAAVCCLAVNDAYLKGTGALPALIAGKLSDVAGLAYFPLVLVTGWNLVGTAAARLLGWSLRAATATWPQVVASVVATGAVFTAVKLVPAARDAFVWALTALRPWSHARPAVVLDATDCLALPALALSLWWARTALLQVAPGRLRWIRAAPSVAAAVGDLERLAPAASRATLMELALEVRGDGRCEVIDAHLKTLRRK